MKFVFLYWFAIISYVTSLAQIITAKITVDFFLVYSGFF
jgi:hypothetical protein